MRKKMAMLLAMVTLVTTAGCGGSGEGGNSSAKTDNGNEGTNGAVEIEYLERPWKRQLQNSMHHRMKWL